MKKICGFSAAFLLTIAMAMSSPSAAFAGESSGDTGVQKLKVIEASDNAGASTVTGMKIGYGLDIIYDDNDDSQLYTTKIENILKSCEKTAKNSSSDVTRLKSQLKTTSRMLKNIKRAKAIILNTASAANDNAAILKRVQYAQDRITNYRKDLKVQLAAAKKAAEVQTQYASSAKEYTDTAQDYSYDDASGDQQNTDYDAEQTDEQDSGISESECSDSEMDNCSSQADTSGSEASETESSEADVSENDSSENDAETAAPDSENEESYSETQAPAAASSAGNDAENDSEDNSDSQDSSSQNSSSSGSRFIWPTSGTTVTSGYGSREAPTAGATTDHHGIDIAADEGSDVYAAASGTVSDSGYNDAMGNYVVLDNGDGVSTIYEHCSSVYASDGDEVSQGDTIAAAGSTGIATGSHLHFGVEVNGEYVDPSDYYNQ